MEKRRKIISRISKKFELDIIYVFGSQNKEVSRWVNGDFSVLKIPAFSDVDIGVKPYPGKDLAIRQKILLTIAFEDFFGVNKIDLVVIPEADPFLAANIIRGERIYCKDEYLADVYELYILRRAGDLAPLERERMALIMEKK